MPTSSKSRRRRERLCLADGRRYQNTVTENEILDYEGVSRKRMRVLDLDSVPVAVLHHSFMFLLVKHLPAEICMKVISRIATYRDIHTQLAYENLIRDLGFLLTKHYESCTAIPHSLGPTFIAYLSRILQTISIAWSVDYIRRYGCFSKKFIAQQIERSTNPRLFDCVRYEKNGGVKPLPPIITHPHRLSSYVRLLDECSAKFYMYTHLKRHGQIPMQQQLQHQVAAQQHLENGETDEDVKSFQVSREYGACTAGHAGSAIPAIFTAPPENESIEIEHRLPRPFVAAEKLLQRSKATRRSRPLAKQHSGTPKPERDGRLKERDKDVNLRNDTLATKRPEIYDLILAAEHLGLNYRQLQKHAVLWKTMESGAVYKEDGETSATALHEKEICSDDEEDPDELELRELLVDDENVYHHILHKYIRRKNGQAEGIDSAPEGEEKADELHKDEVLCEKTEDGGEDDCDTDRGLAQGRRQDEWWLRTSFPVEVATTGGEMVCAHTPDASGGRSAHIPIHAGNGDGSICEASAHVKADSNDGWHSRSILPYAKKKMQDTYGRLSTKYAAAEDPLNKELISAAGTAPESSTLVSDADAQKQDTSTVLPVYCFAAGSAIPCVDDSNPFNSRALSSTGGTHSALAITTHTSVLHRSDAASCGMRSEVECGNGEKMKGKRKFPLENVGSSAASAGTPRRSKEGTNNTAARFDKSSPVEGGAAFRMQNTFVAPLEWMSKSRVRRRRDKRDIAVENALLPCIRDHDDEAQWGWQWNFTADKSDAPSAQKRLEEEGCAAAGGTKEQWWRTPWGRNRAFFRFKGNAYALIPGQGWKRMNAGLSTLLKPKKRNCRHELKRERRMERKVRLRQVREEILQQQIREER